MSNLLGRARQLVGKERVMLETARVARLECTRIAGEMAELDRLLSRKEEMQNTLQHLQVAAQGKNKSGFEDLLTSLIHDIIPGKDDRVTFTTGISRNLASLDIDIIVNGNLENIEDDKGGSICNIVAMGLRFVVLSRNPNRRILMFDEADCHLSREYIPAFAAVLNSLAFDLGMQVLYISHHPQSNFEGYGRIIQLYKTNDKIHTRIVGEESAYPEGYEPPESAIRYIRLKNYGPHENTFVELSPALNIICGDVDLGKSKLIQAIAELTENKGIERRIKHHKSSFEVELGLEENMSLTWSYARKGTKRTKYVLKDKNSEPVETSDEGTDIPDWLHRYLAMAPVNGENIHLHSQKDPSYLLNSNKYSSTKRAQMLPLGRGSRDVLTMIQIFNSRVQSATQDRKRLEKELIKTQNLLATMSLILDNPIDLDKTYQICDELTKTIADHDKHFELIGRLEKLELMNTLYAMGIKQLDRLVVAPLTLISDDRMEQSANSIEGLMNKSKVLAKISQIKPAGKAPVLQDLAGIAAAGSRINTLRTSMAHIDRIKDLIPAVKATLSDNTVLETSIESIDALQTRKNNGAKVLDDCLAKMQNIKDEKAALIEEMGGLCPTCEKPLGAHSHD
jgi:DNA repair ATPase RecN